MVDLRPLIDATAAVEEGLGLGPGADATAGPGPEAEGRPAEVAPDPAARVQEAVPDLQLGIGRFLAPGASPGPDLDHKFFLGRGRQCAAV